jgi:hypothetical protein
LFRYPDLGIAIVNGIAAEQDDAPGVRSAVVIDPHSVDSADAQTALVRRTDMGVLSKALRGRVATVHQASKTITCQPSSRSGGAGEAIVAGSVRSARSRRHSQ